MNYYETASEQFNNILLRYTPAHEPYGYDEAFLNMQGTQRLFGTAETAGKLIRTEIQNEIGITASIGIASNHVVAKVASETAKPDGMLSIRAGAEAEFLSPLALRNLPMIGPKTEHVLKRLGLKTIGDLASFPREILIERLGKIGSVLHNRAQGVDLNPLHPRTIKSKSFSRETTFTMDEPSKTRLRGVLRSQAEKIARDISKNRQGARTVIVKIRFTPFETFSRSTTSSTQVTSSDQLFARTITLFESIWSEYGYPPLRLIGVGVTNLSPLAQQLQFGEELSTLQPNINKLRQRYGEKIILRAVELKNPTRKPYRFKKATTAPHEER